MTSIIVDQRSWKLPDPVAMVRDLIATPAIKRVRFVRGCERCGVICFFSQISDLNLRCTCCRNYGTRMGGNRIVYPEDGLHHIRVCTVDVFLDRMRSLAA